MNRYEVDIDSLRYAMRRAGYDQGWYVSRLADDSGVALSVLRRVLKGGTKCPNTSFMMQLAETLGCEVDDLMTRRSF